MADDLLLQMNQLLDTREGVVRGWAARRAGDVPLRWIAPSVRAKLGDRLTSLSINYSSLSVAVLSERLRITGATINGQPDAASWALWKRSEMDSGASQVHDLALSLGASLVSVWADSTGTPTPRVEHPAQCTWTTDPATGELRTVLKRWVDANTKKAFAVLYESHQIRFYVSDSYIPVDVSAPGFAVGAIPSSGWTLQQTLPNPLGTPPFAVFVNCPTLENPYGIAEFESIADLNDSLIKVATDMLVTSEASAMPRRWATGLEADVDDDGNIIDPYVGKTTTAISEAVDTKFGQFNASDLAAYRTATEIILRQISALSGIPPYACGLESQQATSADAIRASESALVAKAEQRQRDFGPSWARVFRLMTAISTNQPLTQISAEISWGDPASRSVAQESDAVVKLFSAGLLSRSTALRKLGFSDDEISAELRASSAEAVIAALSRPQGAA